MPFFRETLNSNSLSAEPLRDEYLGAVTSSIAEQRPRPGPPIPAGFTVMTYLADLLEGSVR